MSPGSGVWRVIFVGGASRDPADCSSLLSARVAAAAHAQQLIRPREAMGWKEEEGRLRVGRTQPNVTGERPWWIETLAVIEELPQ